MLKIWIISPITRDWEPFTNTLGLPYLKRKSLKTLLVLYPFTKIV